MSTGAAGRGLEVGTDLLQRLATDPGLLPHKIDWARQAVLLVAMGAEDYRRHSFLDDRMLGADARASWLTLNAFEDVAVDAGASPHFIFHVGHCGSTLLSRVLSELERVLPLREPLPLRWLADEARKQGQAHWLLGKARHAALLQRFQALWARTYDAGQRVLLKATSGCNDLAAPLLAAASQPRALALYIGLEDYVATMLKNEGGYTDLYGFAEARLERLHSAIGATPWTLAELSPGEIAAMGWCTEVLALSRCGDAQGRLRWLDFDALLADPRGTLESVAAHFDLEPTAAELDRLEGSDAFGRYAKAPAYRFDPVLRREQLDESGRRNAGELERARGWLNDARARIDGLSAAPPFAG